MKLKLPLLFVFFAGQCVFGKLTAQVKNRNLTIVYNITVNKTKKSTGIEETYNGGTKTLFITNNKARIRLASLMRMESIFFEYDNTLKEARVIKESGTKKYQYKLNAADWENYNSKYAGATCDTINNDSIMIAGYNCKKAVLHLSSGETITTYYTDSISIGNHFIESAFASIPGIVLQYEYVSKRGSVTFKASEVKREPISKDIFVIPTAGVATKKYVAKKIEREQLDEE